jgi:hypothetical protein
MTKASQDEINLATVRILFNRVVQHRPIRIEPDLNLSLDIWRVLSLLAGEAVGKLRSRCEEKGFDIRNALIDTPGFIAAAYISPDAVYGFLNLVLHRWADKLPATEREQMADALMEHLYCRFDLPLQVKPNDCSGWRVLV